MSTTTIQQSSSRPGPSVSFALRAPEESTSTVRRSPALPVDERSQTEDLSEAGSLSPERRNTDKGKERDMDRTTVIDLPDPFPELLEYNGPTDRRYIIGRSGTS